MSEYKDTTNRHLRHKLQSLGRRLDELEEATNKLQKSEDELLDLQDKIIQAEGSNSALLGDVEALRKRLLKIEGKDEEVCKAEDLCRTVREKLEEEESLTKELKTEIERLQRRMAELEKLEEAFGKSKSDCGQLCLSLNEEKNLTRKLSSELEALKARMKEVDTSEARLDRAEQALAGELEKLKGFTQTFASERKRLVEKQREDEKLILKLTEKLERQKNRTGPADPGRADLRELRIEDDLTSGLTGKPGRKKSLDYAKLAEDVGLRNKSENEKNSLEGQEDNKVRELTQEVERLKSRLKQLELVEEDLRNTESKNGELRDKFQKERSRTRALNEQMEQLRMQLGGAGGGASGNHGNGSPAECPAKVLENGKAENEEINVRGGFRQEKPKYRSAAAASEPTTPKHKTRELSPQHKREPKARSKEPGHSEEGSPKSVRRALSPAHKSRRTPKTTAASDNGVRETGRGAEEKSSRAAGHGTAGSSSGDAKKVSVLSRYPPAANDQKSWKTSQKPGDGESKKNRVEKFSKLYAGSDSESNNSDVVLESSSKTNSISLPEKEASDPELLDQVQDGLPAPGISKANGSYTAYRSHVSPLLPSDHGSEGHSSASETESTGSRPSEPEPAAEVTAPSSRTTTPKYPRYSRLQQDSHSEGSSSRSSFDEELHRPLLAEGGGSQETHTPSGIEIRRVCSPREALRSKAVIKPAIVEIDRKEVMISGGGAEPLTTNGKPKISTKPLLTSKKTSSITIYPNDPSSSRTSSRSSSVSSEPPIRERHTSTSNILIGPSSEHRGSVSVPYEISIPKSEITLRPSLDSGEDPNPQGGTLETTRVAETHLRSRSSFNLQSPETTGDFNNDTESGFESSSSSSTTTVTSWRSHGHALGHGSRDDSLPEMRNVTVRSTWRNRGAVSVDEPGYRGTGGTVGGGARTDGGSEDEAESATTWRAYRATTVLDAEDALSATPAAAAVSASSAASASQRGAKPSPAEVYMRRINSGETAGSEASRRSKNAPSTTEVVGLGRSIPHEPVSSQSWGRTPAPAAEDAGPSPNPASWRRQSPGDPPYEPRSARADRDGRGATPKGEPWSSRGQAEGRTGSGTRPWSNRQSDN